MDLRAHDCRCTMKDMDLPVPCAQTDRPPPSEVTGSSPSRADDRFYRPLGDPHHGCQTAPRSAHRSPSRRRRAEDRRDHHPGLGEREAATRNGDRRRQRQASETTATRVPLDVKPGDLILFGKYTSQESSSMARSSSSCEKTKCWRSSTTRLRRTGERESSVMAKQIVYGDASRQGILRGVNSLANAVKVTLGTARAQRHSRQERSGRRPSPRTASRSRRRSS